MMDYFIATLYAGTELLSKNIVSAILASIACVLSLYVYHDSKNKHQYWTQLGVKGPKPVPVLGNLISLLTGERTEKELEWVKKYGKVYGIYQGTKPHLVIADPEVLLQICIKDFEKFPNHIDQEFINHFFNLALFNQRNSEWKRSRALMSPTFTSRKIRRMFQFLDGCADDLIECFKCQMAKSEEGAVINVKNLYANFTMDAITTCCYGLKLDRVNSTSATGVTPRDEFVKNAMLIFNFSVARLIMQFFMPDFLLKLVGFQVSPDKNHEPLAKRVQQLINQRRKSSSKKFDDYLQILIDAKLDDQIELDEMDSAENHHVAETEETILEGQRRILNDIKIESNSKATLTDSEILSNAVVLMVVGLETTSTLLAHCTYSLAFHPEIQERLYGELIQIAQFDEKKKNFRFEYGALTSCKYLDACLSEALRLLTPVIQLDRQSNQDYYLEKYNLLLPKNSRILLAYFAILNDPDNWSEPQKFNPERFMPENRDKIVPGSYCPFGLGPRHCLGMRFSLTESKLGLAKMVVNYRFLPAPGTRFPPEPKRSFGMHNIKTPIVTAVNRL